MSGPSGVTTAEVQRRAARRPSRPGPSRAGRGPRLLLVDVGDAGDPVQGEGAVLLAQVVPGGDEAALDAARLDDARGRPALRVDVAEPDLAALAGGLTAGRPACRRSSSGWWSPGARRAARAARSPARSAVTDSAACSGGSEGSPTPVRPGPQRGAPDRRGPASSSAPSGASAAGAKPAARSASSTVSSGEPLTSTVGARRRRRSGCDPLGDQHLRQQRLVVAAQVGRGDADAHAAVPAGDVVDEVGQRLRHRRARAGAEQLLQVARGAPGVERAAHGRLADAVDGRAAGRLDVGDQRELAGQLALERTGRDDGEVGLHEHVVERRGQAERPAAGPPRRRRRRAAARAGARQAAAAGEAEPLGLGERPAVHQVAQPARRGAAPTRRAAGATLSGVDGVPRPARRPARRGRGGARPERRAARRRGRAARAPCRGRRARRPGRAGAASSARPARARSSAARAVRAAQVSYTGVGTHSGSRPGVWSTSPAATATSTSSAARVSSASMTAAARLSSRTPSPPARSTPGGLAVHASSSASTFVTASAAASVAAPSRSATRDVSSAWRGGPHVAERRGAPHRQADLARQLDGVVVERARAARARAASAPASRRLSGPAGRLASRTCPSGEPFASVSSTRRSGSPAVASSARQPVGVAEQLDDAADARRRRAAARPARRP